MPAGTDSGPGISRAGSSTAPRTAAQLEAAYGEELRAPPYSQDLGHRALRQALADRDPPVQVTAQVCRTWIARYRLAPDAISVTSVGVLEERYGKEVRRLAAVHTTASLLDKALRERKPPLAVTFSLLHNWLQKYGPDTAKTIVHSAGQLEMLYGDRLRDEYAGKDLDARSIVTWLLEAESASVSVQSCQTWIEKDWSTSGKLYLPSALEQAAGERLRLDEYTDCFKDEVSARALQVSLAEGQPPLRTTASALLSWYKQYHPEGGPLRYASAADLEAAMGDDLRSSYAGLRDRTLVSTLQRRRKPVLVTRQVSPAPDR